MRRKRGKKDWKLILLIEFMIISVLGISIGYSSLNTNLTLSGDAYVRVEEDIRITDLKMKETNGVYETYNSKYAKDTTSMFLSFRQQSSITYEAVITNNSDSSYQVEDIVLESELDGGISYKFIGLTVGDLIKPHTTVTFQIYANSNLGWNLSGIPVVVDCALSFRFVFKGYDTTQLLSNVIIADNGGGTPDNVNSTYVTNNYGINFSEISSSNNGQGLYVTAGNNLLRTQNNKEVYYFRGAVENNFVEFGEDSSGLKLYWKIIRIDENRGIKLIYNGTSTDATKAATQIGSFKYNETFGSNGSLGYMYGVIPNVTYEAEHQNLNESNVKVQLDTWFENNLQEERKYLSENTIYCNNRVTSEDGSEYLSLGYSKNKTSYGRYGLFTTKNPLYRCPLQNDRFTSSTSTIGNKKLKYPVGLITADEVAFEGGVVNVSNTSFYLYNEQNYWTMSPFYFNGAYAHVLFVGLGALKSNNVTASYGLRPVITLKPGVIYRSGDGTASSPYTIK